MVKDMIQEEHLMEYIWWKKIVKQLVDTEKNPVFLLLVQVQNRQMKARVSITIPKFKTSNDDDSGGSKKSPSNKSSSRRKKLLSVNQQPNLKSVLLGFLLTKQPKLFAKIASQEHTQTNHQQRLVPNVPQLHLKINHVQSNVVLVNRNTPKDSYLPCFCLSFHRLNRCCLVSLRFLRLFF